MPGRTITTVGLEMPDDFPCSPYDTIHKQVSGSFQNPDPLDQYAGAWNAVAYRFASCTDHDARFIATTRRVARSTAQVMPLVSLRKATLIQDLIIGSVEELGESGQDRGYGSGRLDVLRAIDFAVERGFGRSG